jgi:hypothetical protein
MFVKLLNTAALVLGLASTAAIACPTGADMKKGVLFRTDLGNTELHRRTKPGWVQIRTAFSDGGGTLIEADRGLYMHSSTRIEAGKLTKDKITFASRSNLRKWSDPKPDTRWRNPTDGGGTAKSGPIGSFRVGTCTFSAFPVTIDFDGEVYSETYMYLPDLGTGLLTRSKDARTTETYGYIAVGLMP